MRLSIDQLATLFALAATLGAAGYDSKLARGLSALQRQATANTEHAANGRRTLPAERQRTATKKPLNAEEQAAQENRLATLGNNELVAITRKLTAAASVYNKPRQQSLRKPSQQPAKKPRGGKKPTKKPADDKEPTKKPAGSKKPRDRRKRESGKPSRRHARQKAQSPAEDEQTQPLEPKAAEQFMPVGLQLRPKPEENPGLPGSSAPSPSP
jgi:hypothetical protein